MNITYSQLLDQVKDYNPTKYATTRNYTNGAVTSWSPYISRGFLSPVTVMEQIQARYPKHLWMGFVQQMAWREYFQRVWQNKGEDIFLDLKSVQQNCMLQEVPKPILHANTGVKAIDIAVQQLYDHGYIHNHLRMYLSMLHSNIFKAAWLPGAKWMYAHLLDHDPAANFLSWQWVAGTFSSKQYVANQENINKFTNTHQVGTFLDTAYENLNTAIFDYDGVVQKKYQDKWSNLIDGTYHVDIASFLNQLKNELVGTQFECKDLDATLPYCIYNSFNLDPLWHKEEQVNRILLLEPRHYSELPIAKNVLQFIVDLAKLNLPNLKIFIGNFEDLNGAIQNNALKAGALENSKPILYFKEHPTTTHYQGVQEQRDWLFPQITGYFPSFFGFWKKCEYLLKK